MALEVYFQQDIINALLAAEQASSAGAMAVGCGKDNEFSQGFQVGYRAALTTLALAFGLVEFRDHFRRTSPLNELVFNSFLLGDRR